ncbi:gluconokinase [Streptomyces sp. TRM 70351]|uniref:gluconokinase n=1 Tax=Streptomyces sp. TRM 70351 TaxID=3116552 RepID=UPI002E7BA5BE|nr:gluconokinase [Streptomyces sp. TRM 70351]MEE1929225.1 gluconokinase [Streptomyces sp. TRM 70351]
MTALVVVMGVSGSGKTTVGTLLAERLAVPYADADEFHPPENVAKMAAGTPLDDADREPWLDAIGAWLAGRAEHAGGVVTCSALKRGYRDRLRAAAPGAFFVHLDGSPELIADRLSGRRGHFMPSSLLRSQFDTLEPLAGDEPGAAVSIEGSAEDTVERALAAVPR